MYFAGKNSEVFMLGFLSCAAHGFAPGVAASTGVVV